MNNSPGSVCLFPFGSANEEISGISHFFEHLLILFLRHHFQKQGAMVNGHTTEDYVVLLAENLSGLDMATGISEIHFESMAVEDCRRSLLKEIVGKRGHYEESFFSAIWAGTDYEKSPLGDANRVQEITVAELEDFKHQICQNNLYIYDQNNTPYILPTPNSAISHQKMAPQRPPRIPRTRATGRVEKLIHGKDLNVFFINEQIERALLLVYILKELNPGKQVQLSEKKEMSALIVEKGIKWPSPDNINALRPKVIEHITLELTAIKSDFQDEALNQLESLYFYGLPWSKRIKTLMTTTNGELLQHPQI